MTVLEHKNYILILNCLFTNTTRTHRRSRIQMNTLIKTNMKILMNFIFKISNSSNPEVCRKRAASVAQERSPPPKFHLG